MEGLEVEIDEIVVANGERGRGPRDAGLAERLLERQVGAVWLAFLAGCLVTMVLNHLLELPPYRLSPVVAVLFGVALCGLGTVLPGWFYGGAAASLLVAPLMVLVVPYEFLLFGIVLFVALLIPALGHPPGEQERAP